MLDCLCGYKGVIPYEKIKSHEDLDAAPKSEFYSSLNNEIIDDKSYESVKKFWRLMRLNKLSELNDIYDFQETIILCEFFGNRAIEMMQKFPYNLRKCTSATSLSGCIHRFLLKAITALPTPAEIVDLFEQKLIG